MNSLKISTLIFNWNERKYTIKYLELSYQTTYSNYRIILIENGSSEENKICKMEDKNEI